MLEQNLLLSSVWAFLSLLLAVELNDVQSVANPLDKVEAGLQAGGKAVPLQSVHVRAQLMDLAAQVGTQTHISRLNS